MRILLMSFVALAMTALSSAQSIAPGLAGTWVLQADADASRTRRPITGLSIATRLVIRESPAEITMETNTGSNNTLVTTAYKLDGSEHAIPGPIGWETRAQTKRDGDRLLVSIRRSVQGPEGELVFNISETYTPTGDTLLLERTQGRTTQKLVYKRGE